MKQALLVINMQNGFLSSESPWCIPGARDVVPAIARLLAACRRSGTPVIFVNRACRADGSDVDFSRRERWIKGGKPLTLGSTGPLSAENPPEFARCAGDYEIIRSRCSAFFQTGLELLLRQLDVDMVLLAGADTSHCVRATCYDALSWGYLTAVVEDCCACACREVWRSNLRDMTEAGAEVLPSSCFLRELAGMIVRPAVMADLERCAEIESLCFPPAQAASREVLRRRIQAYPETVLVGELDGEIVGYVMGPVIRQSTITDEMFADPGCGWFHNPYQAVFSLAVHPDFQGRDYGRILLGELIRASRKSGRRGVVLTCKEEKIAYYESFGFENRGVSKSVHGGAVWYDMLLPIEAL